MTTLKGTLAHPVNALRLWLGILAFAQTVSASIGLIGIVSGKESALLALIVSGAQVGTVVYLTPAPPSIAYPPTPPVPAVRPPESSGGPPVAPPGR